MTAAPLPCPACAAEMRRDARYCHQCGIEAYMPCPACGAAPRWLATMGLEEVPWCEGCHTLLNRCERCGRWLLPATERCPDPHCGGRVLPLLPQHTGRRWDARGTGADWKWPATWERSHPEPARPMVDRWASAEELHAAFAAHGRLYLWEGTNLLSPDEWAGWTPGAAESPVAWRCSLGPSGSPAEHLPPSERIAVAGARAILAVARGYLAVDLRHAGDLGPIAAGRPLAQAGGPGWWLGWSETSSGPVLRMAEVGEPGDLLEAAPVAVPPEGALASRGRLAMKEGTAYWPAADHSIWKLERSTRLAAKAVAPLEGMPLVWAEADGPRAARESRGRLSVGVSAPADGRFGLSIPAGVPPLRAVFAMPGYVVVLGDQLAAFDAATGELLHEASAPPGTYIDGALVTAADGEPRLLALTREAPFGELTVLRLSSGARESLWREAGMEPRSLLPVGDTLYLTHRRGVVRLMETHG